MKKLFSTIYFLLFGNMIFAQNAYYETLYFQSLNLADIKNNIIESNNLTKEFRDTSIVKFDENFIKLKDSKGKDALLVKLQNLYKDENFFRNVENIVTIQGKHTSSTLTKQDFIIFEELYNFKTKPFSNEKPDLSKLKAAFDKINFTTEKVESVAAMSLVNLLNPLGLLQLLPKAQADTLLKGIAVYATEQAKRTHQETMVNIINKRFGKYHDFQMLFPATYAKLNTQDWLRVKDFGNELKTVFKKDYDDFYGNFYRLIENPKKEDWSAKDRLIFSDSLRRIIYEKPQYAWTKVFLDAGKQIIDGSHPVTVLENLNNKYKNYKDSLFTTQSLEKSNKFLKLDKNALEVLEDLVLINNANISLPMITIKVPQGKSIPNYFANQKKVGQINITFQPKDTANLNIVSLNAFNFVYSQMVKQKFAKGSILTIDNQQFQVNKDTVLSTYIEKKDILNANTTVALKKVKSLSLPSNVDWKIAFDQPQKTHFKSVAANGKIFLYEKKISPTSNEIQYNGAKLELAVSNSLNNLILQKDSLIINDNLSFDKESLTFEYKSISKIDTLSLDTLKLNKGDKIVLLKGMKFSASNDSSIKSLNEGLQANAKISETLSKSEDYKKVYDFIRALNLVQHNLRDTSQKVNGKFSNVWIDFDKFAKIDKSPERQLLFLSLLYHADSSAFVNLCKNANISLNQLRGFNLSDLKNPDKLLIINSFDSFKQKYISPLLTTLIQSEDYLKMKDDKIYEEENFKNYIKFFGNMISNFDYQKESFPKDLFELFDSAAGVLNAVKTRNFSNFLFDFAGIIKYNVAQDIAKNPQDTPEVKKLYNVLDKLDYFGGFTSAIINTKTSQDVNNVLKSYVRANTSYMVNRTKPFTVSLVAQPGVVLGYDWENYKDQPNKTATSTLTGLSLPVGMRFSFHNIKIKNKNYIKKGSLNLMFNPIDLGSLVNYRLRTDDGTTASPIQLPKANQNSEDQNGNKIEGKPISDFFRRNTGFGLTLGYSMPNLPISIDLGWQRSYAKEKFVLDNKLIVNSNERLFIRVSYDISLLTIFSGSLRKSK